ncbi:MAG: phosphotransferase [Desulfobulbaceae bacterium]|nr:phosphotransferase [Desulfobulbaceae bacterium]
MSKTYLGTLSIHDPLHSYLQTEIFPLLNQANSIKPTVHVYSLTGSNDVYLYEARNTGVRVVGKFFLTKKNQNPARAERWMAREFENLKKARSYNLNAPPCYVIKPLGCNQAINCFLVVEYCRGTLFSEIIRTAIHQGRRHRLYRKLSALAFFLSALHNRSVTPYPVDFNQDCSYLDKLLTVLHDQNKIDHHEVEEFYRLRERWRAHDIMWGDRQVFVHGDATPDNFLFAAGNDVVAFDMERAKLADRVFDLGRIAGELKHFFMAGTGDKYAAEPFIGHFLWEYCGYFPDRENAFQAITRRIPFHLGLTLLRIARNSWINPAHRHMLLEEAKLNFRSSP